MKLQIEKSGAWAFRGVDIIYIESGTHNCHNDLANELIEAGWATPYLTETEPVLSDEEADYIKESFDREEAEEKYKNLGGRVRKDWTDEELFERIEAKKAE